MALSKALESGNCKLTSLDVSCESEVAVRCVCCCAWVCVWLDGAWAFWLMHACCGVELVRSEGGKKG